MKQSLILCLLFAFFACKNEPKMEKVELKGKWNLTEAFRNDKKTQTLTGAYYIFTDSTITTNLFGETITTPYKFDKMVIVQRVPTEVRYSVTANKDKTLSLVTLIDDIPFRFTLKKE